MRPRPNTSHSSTRLVKLECSPMTPTAEVGSATTSHHSVSVAGVVINDRNEIFVIKRRDNGQWEPPGGILELGETFEQGVQREVLEETGVSVTVDRLTGVYKNMARGIVALVFHCTPIAGKPISTPEAVAVQWTSLPAVA